MKYKLLLALLIVGGVLVATAAKDPVLMKINGKEIKLSEFEYLYHKNSQQQLEKESLDDYVDRFVNYKLKVADAEAAQIDTLPGFKDEFNGYKTDIVKSFLEDTTVTTRLVNEAYERMKTNVDIDHFMYSLPVDYTDRVKKMAFVDSIRTCILNGENWEDLAVKYSIDPSVKSNKGHYGFIASGVFPYDFEYEVYNTPVGQITKPFTTDFGIHLVRVNDVRPAKEVKVKHILKLFRSNPRSREEVTDSMKTVTKLAIDSVYDRLKAGADFSELAVEASQDPGSARKGGELPWFGPGRMVPEFEKVAFELANGEMSEPFETPYGYHIVLKLDERNAPDFDEAKKTILGQISRDRRASMPRDERIAQVKKMYDYKLNPKLHDYLEKMVADNGGYDSTLVAKIAQSDMPMFTFAKTESAPLKEIARHLNKRTVIKPEAAVGYIESFVEPKSRDIIMQYYADNLIRDNVDYRNLLNEYRDGMLLFEISNQKVWEAAGRDTLGLEGQFLANRDKYKWDTPRFKGIILSAVNDSTLNAVRADLDVMHKNQVPLDTITSRLHKKYASNIKMERMLMAKGENKTVDFLYFDGPDPGNAKYPLCMTLSGGLLYQPEELSDVRGQVTSDYQDVLERRWLQELKAKYPVVIDKKVLKKVKE